MPETRLQRVLIICTGNSCRSRMAEGRLRARGEIGQWLVETFGAHS